MGGYGCSVDAWEVGGGNEGGEVNVLVIFG